MYREQTVSFEQMNTSANRVANAFLEMGIAKGDRVIILLENCLEWLYTWFGLAKIGAVAVPINTGHRGSVLEHMISSAAAKVMVTGKGYPEYIQNLTRQPEKLQTKIICCDDEQPQSLRMDFIPYSELLAASPSATDCGINHYDPSWNRLSTPIPKFWNVLPSGCLRSWAMKTSRWRLNSSRACLLRRRK